MQLAHPPIAWVHLEPGPASWKRRKSYKSLINWGRRNLRLIIVNKDAPLAYPLKAAREFHARISGRVTRSPRSWDLQFNEIVEGRGEAIFGLLNNDLVTASLFLDGRDICVYATGIYERSLELPLAHYPLWTAINRAYQRKMKWFELGEAPMEGDPKQVSIGFFKRGFATHILS